MVSVHPVEKDVPSARAQPPAISVLPQPILITTELANALMDTSLPSLPPDIAEDAPTKLSLAAAILKPSLVLPTSTSSTEPVSAHQEDISTILETACPV